MSNEPTVAELQALVADLTTRLSALEGQVSELRSNEEISEDTMVAISAAVAAFLGHKAKVRAVRLHGSRGWAQEGRERVHDRSVPHVR
ncbi:hypothetical protein [Nigerium sp.]|uniref:hypothetical protein n=1 Tax=Nigerium sp. TaxID=2042655 RepID=UPI00322183A7